MTSGDLPVTPVRPPPRLRLRGQPGTGCNGAPATPPPVGSPGRFGATGGEADGVEDGGIYYVVCPAGAREGDHVPVHGEGDAGGVLAIVPCGVHAGDEFAVHASELVERGVDALLEMTC